LRPVLSAGAGREIRTTAGQQTGTPFSIVSAANPSGFTMIPSQQPQEHAQSLTGLRLRKHVDYQQAYAGSRKRQSASMSWFMAMRAREAARDQPAARVGLTVGKVVGKAHERNRIKRRMREVLRRHVELLPAGADLIFHPRRTVLSMDFGKLEAEVVRILTQARAEAAGPSR
jgi:ribonuclease P protein component